MGSVVERVNAAASSEEDGSLSSWLDTCAAKDLRAACRHFRAGVRTKGGLRDNKIGYIDALLDVVAAKRDSAAIVAEGGGKASTLPPTPKGPRRSRDCPLRLMNVLMSDRFCWRLEEMNATPTRRQLDAGAVNGNNAFWKEVEDEFGKDKEEYRTSITNDERFAGFDLGRMLNHDSAKLQDMWKGVAAKYATAHARSKASGSHDPEFFNYCSGSLEVLYLHHWLQLRPHALANVEAKLPKRSRVDTLCPSWSVSDASSEESTPSKRRRSDSQRVIQLMEKFFDNNETDTQQRSIATYTELEKVLSTFRLAKEVGVGEAKLSLLQQKVDECFAKVSQLD